MFIFSGVHKIKNSHEEELCHEEMGPDRLLDLYGRVWDGLAEGWKGAYLVGLVLKVCRYYGMDLGVL